MAVLSLPDGFSRFLGQSALFWEKRMLQLAVWDVSQATRVSVCSVDQIMVNLSGWKVSEGGGVITVGSC